MSGRGETIRERLARIEEKLDTVLSRCPRSEARLAALESWRAKAIGVLAVLALLWPVAVRAVQQWAGV
jgi:ribosomal 50S subunit-associated protein YjgA (DUF615 family)